MDSSFLNWFLPTVVNVGLGLYSGILFLKMIIQFGLPNHPTRFTAYMVALCAAAFFITKAAVDLNLVAPWTWIKFRPLPLVAGSVALLLQSVMLIGQFSLIQQKVVSRIPLMAGLLCFAFFPAYADLFFGVAILAASLFLSISVGKARLQRRLFIKMAFFIGLFGLFLLPQEFSLHIFGQLFLIFGLFYFFLFEQSFCISAMMDEFRNSHEGS